MMIHMYEKVRQREERSGEPAGKENGHVIY